MNFSAVVFSLFFLYGMSMGNPAKQASDAGGHPTEGGHDISLKETNADTGCEECMIVMDVVALYLKEPSTQNELRAALQNICTTYSVLFREPCMTYLNQYGDDVMDMMSASFEPLQTCQMSGQCSRKDKNIMAEETLEDAECDMCHEVLTITTQFLRGGGTVTQMADEMSSNICAQLVPAYMLSMCRGVLDDFSIQFIDVMVDTINPTTTCPAVGLCKAQSTPMHDKKDFGKKVVSQEEKIINQVPSTVCDYCKMYVSLEVCQLLGVCPEATVPGVMESTPKDLGHVIHGGSNTDISSILEMVSGSLQQSVTCRMCQMVMSQLEDALEDDATKEQIEDALESVCNFVPEGLHDMCVGFVKMYSPQLITILLQGVNPQVICPLLGFC